MAFEVIVVNVFKKLPAIAAAILLGVLCACASPAPSPEGSAVDSGSSAPQPAAMSENGFPMSDLSGYPAFEGYEGEYVFYDLTVADIQQLMDNGETFCFIAAFSRCPWCNLVITHLNETALAEGVQVGYLNTRLNPEWSSNIDIDDYDVFVELFGDYLREDDEGILHLYTPHVFFIKEGQVVYERSSVVDGADPEAGLTDEQAQELVDDYREGFAAMQ